MGDFTFSNPKNLSLPSARIGPASARSFSSGVGCGALGSFFTGALLAAGLAGLYLAVRTGQCRAKPTPSGAQVLTVPCLNRPKIEFIVVVPSWEVTARVGVAGHHRT